MPYDVAQICLNGHLANSEFNNSPSDRKNFCAKCGEKTITSCEKCGGKIRGSYLAANFMDYNISMDTIPSYCEHCGEPHPWTNRKLQASIDLANELEELTDNDKEIFRDNIKNVLSSNPNTEVSATRIKKIMKKVGKSTSDLFYKIFVDITSEAVKKMIWG